MPNQPEPPESLVPSPLGSAFARIALGYPDARREPFAGHPLVGFIRRDAARAVGAALGPDPRFLVRGSAGWRGWAAVPWIAAFDRSVTASAKRGTYVVYLFHGFEPRVRLALVHGTADLRRRHGDGVRDVLRGIAERIREKVADAAGGLEPGPLDLGTDGTLPLDYGAAVALALTYDAADLPPEPALIDDLRRMARLHDLLLARGGVEDALARGPTPP